MADEFRAICKDCNKEFGYSEASLQSGYTRGLSRPERCPGCRRTHSRESRSIGIAQIKVKPTGPRKPDTELSPGRLGKISHPERPHRKAKVEGQFGKPGSHIEFGITDADMRRLIEAMQTHQVMVVVGPTGSGKSTFLPYRLMVPPEGIKPDIFTRYGQIVITQPRIQATRSIARFVARELHGCSLGAGFDVGFRHSNDPASDWRNKLVYITDGTLINWIVRGQISNLSVIMIDEAHERSLNIDLILGLLKKQLPRFPQLKLIIASATINAELFQNYFGGPDRVALLRFRELKQHNVDAFFPPHGDVLRNDRNVPYTMAYKICDILNDIAEGHKSEGDVLGFLPGEGPIETCAKRVRELIVSNAKLRDLQIDVYPLYTRLPRDRQELALKKKTEVLRDRVLAYLCKDDPLKETKIAVLLLDKKSASEAAKMVENAIEEEGISDWIVTFIEEGKREVETFPKQLLFTTHEAFRHFKNNSQFQVVTDRRVIVSTNVAETSLTVDGIVYVVDSGLIKESRWDSKNSADDLPTIFHSRAGCRQRWGRAGRVRDGEVHTLYTDLQFEEEFSPYTKPEIVRSSLEEVMLKAKAAGIDRLDDIKHFDWIEPPPAEELRRVPEMLRKVGALDAEGDLTHYGEELHSISAGIPVANLLVAADQFACGEEMATLAALLNLRMKGGLFSWDNGWDFATKKAVENTIKRLSNSCQDDLEFYLKIYSIWAEFKSEDERNFFCRFFFINKDNFLNKVIPDRNQFLEMLSIGKKSGEDRTINFDLLDRLRMIFAAYLPSECFYQTSSHKISPVFSGPASDDIPVEIDENSVFFSKLPDRYMALKRRIMQRKGERYLNLSCIIPVKKEWLELRRLTTIHLAAKISMNLAQRTVALRPGANRHRLFLDVRFPIGTRYAKEKADNGLSFAGEKISDPEPVKLVFAAGRVPLPEEDLEQTPRDTDPLAGWDHREDSQIPRDPYGEEPSITQWDVEDQPEELPVGIDDDAVTDTRKTAQVAHQEGSTGGLKGIILTEDYMKAGKMEPIFRWKESDGPDEQCEVVGYDFSDQTDPVVIFEDRKSMPDVSKESTPAVMVKVKVKEVLELVNGARGLRVREESSGSEFILDPASLTFSRRWCFADEFHIGETYEMIVEGHPNGAITLSCLPVAEKKFHEFVKANPGLKRFGETTPVSCRLVEMGYDRLYFAVDDSMNSSPNPVQCAVMKASYDDKKRFKEGKTYRLYLNPQNGEAYVPLPSLPEGLLAFIEKERFSRHIFWNREKYYLHTKKPMTTETCDKLLKYSDASEYRSAIQKLFMRSNLVRVQETAPQNKGPLVTGKSREELFFQEEVPLYNPGQRVRGTVSRIYDKSVLVVLKRGGSGSIFIEDLGWERILDPRELVYVDMEIEADVIRQTDKGVDLRRKFIHEIKIPVKKIRLLIGRKGSTLHQIEKESRCRIRCDNDGAVQIKGTEGDDVEYATELVRKLIPETAELESI